MIYWYWRPIVIIILWHRIEGYEGKEIFNWVSEHFHRRGRRSKLCQWYCMIIKTFRIHTLISFSSKLVYLLCSSHEIRVVEIIIYAFELFVCLCPCDYRRSPVTHHMIHTHIQNVTLFSFNILWSARRNVLT